jgi:hypothetical protein
MNPQAAINSAGQHQPVVGFSHAKHLKIQPACVTCHQQTANSIRTSDHSAPTHAACIACHQGDFLPAAQKCDRCHQALNSVVPEKNQPLPGLKFSHRLHGERKVPCSKCHGDLQKAEPRQPNMDSCIDCHRQKGMVRGCDHCHKTDGTGHLQTHFGDFRLQPNQRVLWEIDHNATFVQQHGREAQKDPTLCQECHSPSTCVTCHQTSRRMGIHPGDYLRHHAVEARHDELKCQSCHQPSTFCLDCHARAGVTIAPGPRQFGKKGRSNRIHPRGFVGRPGALRNANHHAFAARTNLSNCVSCHQENDCVRCHAMNAPSSLRASPHPPQFHCGRALDASARGCLKCHSDLETLRRLCETHGLK